jgi:DNA end-binding protein Ku
MPRAVWKGSLAFALVSIPVSLRTAVAAGGVAFHGIHDEDGGRIRRRAVCSVDGAAVPRAHIVKGFEVERGRWVTVTDAELHALDPVASRTIEIVEFVDPHEIDPILYERTYWLVPDEGAARAYGLLGAAMVGLQRVAIARLTMRGRVHLSAIRPVERDREKGRALALTTLGYADEILPAPSLAGPDAQLGEPELALAERLVESLSGRFRPERYHDERRDKVMALLLQKAEGKTTGELAPPPATPPAPADLRGALEASLAEVERHKAAA